MGSSWASAIVEHHTAPAAVVERMRLPSAVSIVATFASYAVHGTSTRSVLRSSCARCGGYRTSCVSRFSCARG